jgi:hypothetical protein
MADAAGWTLVSAEDRHAAHPGTFEIPPREIREALEPGQAAKLLFDIEIRKGGRVVDRGVDRMWVIVRARTGGRYVGVLDSDPGLAEGLRLRPGDEILFGPEHVVETDNPPRSYVLGKLGPGFFDEVEEP